VSIRVDLVEGRGERLWPRPGRIFAVGRGHTFAALATAIDDAFARWDRAHLHDLRLADGSRLTTPYGDEDELGPSLDDRRTKLSRLRPGEQFLYTFDLGDDWTHLCTVGPERIDPEEELGVVPDVPLAHWGWGAIPDQYGRVGTATMERLGYPAIPAVRTCRRCVRAGGPSSVHDLLRAHIGYWQARRRGSAAPTVPGRQGRYRRFVSSRPDQKSVLRIRAQAQLDRHWAAA